MKDVKCPKCNKLIHFKNLITFDDKVVEIINIAYLLECKKCKTQFIPELRKSKKATDQQIKDVMDMTGFSNFFKTFDSVSKAIDAVKT